MLQQSSFKAIRDTFKALKDFYTFFVLNSVTACKNRFQHLYSSLLLFIVSKTVEWTEWQSCSFCVSRGIRYRLNANGVDRIDIEYSPGNLFKHNAHVYLYSLYSL